MDLGFILLLARWTKTDKRINNPAHDRFAPFWKLTCMARIYSSRGRACELLSCCDLVVTTAQAGSGFVKSFCSYLFSYSKRRREQWSSASCAFAGYVVFSTVPELSELSSVCLKPRESHGTELCYIVLKHIHQPENIIHFQYFYKTQFKLFFHRISLHRYGKHNIWRRGGLALFQNGGIKSHCPLILFYTCFNQSETIYRFFEKGYPKEV